MRTTNREVMAPSFARRVVRFLSSVSPALALLAAMGCASAALQQAAPAPAPAAPQGETMHGVASWYGEEFAGRTTANGEIFEPLNLTAAHRTLPFGTIVDVRNSQNGKTVRVRINDRGPFVADRLIDLSYAAAKEIGLVEPGSGEVDMTVVSLGRGDLEPPAPYTVTLAHPNGSSAQQADQVATAEAARPESPTEPATVQPAAATSPAAPEVSPAPASAPAATAPASTTAAATEANAEVAPAPAATGQPAAAGAPIDPDRAFGRTTPPEPVRVAAEPPPVDFPLPGDVGKPSTGTSAAAPSAAPPVETRRQVATDGRTVQTVARAGGEPVPPAPQTSPRGRRFLVQVGAFSVQANAKALVDLLAGFGMTGRIDHETTLFRVRLGPFGTREEAIRVRSQLETKGVSAIVIGE